MTKLTLEKIVELMGNTGDLQATVDFVNENFVHRQDLIKFAEENKNKEYPYNHHSDYTVPYDDLINFAKGESNDKNGK